MHRLNGARPQCLHSPALRPRAVPTFTFSAVPGPSTLPLPARRLNSTFSTPSTSSSSATPLDVPPSPLSAHPEFPAELGAEADELELNVAEDMPPNVSFEESEAVRARLRRTLATQGEVLHVSPSDPFNPIVVPASSLASSHPTAAAEPELLVELSQELFGQPLRRDILHRCVVWYLSTLRQGSQSTKNRSTVAYSGRKLRPQKGTGRARTGDASSGIRRGGAPIFELKPRDHAQLLPRKIRDLGLRIALSSKLSSGFLRVVGDLNEGQWQGTADARRALSNVAASSELSTEEVAIASSTENITQRFGWSSDLSILFLHSPFTDAAAAENIARVTRNIPNVEVMSTDEVTAYHVLKYKWTVLDWTAVDTLANEVGEYVVDEEAEGVEVQA